MLGLVVKVSTFDDIVSIRKICTFSLGFQIFSGSQFYSTPLPASHVHRRNSHVGVAKSERPRLINGEIIFEEFQPM